MNSEKFIAMVPLRFSRAIGFLHLHLAVFLLVPATVVPAMDMQGKARLRVLFYPGTARLG